MGVGVAPGFAHRGGATRQAHGPEVADATVAAVVADQELPAPERAVVPQAEPVHGDAEHRRGVQGTPVLAQAGGDVGVMVLHLEDGAPAGDLVGAAGGEVVGVGVDDEGLWIVSVEAAEERQRASRLLERRQLLEIAQVLAEQGAAVAHEAERVLQLTAERRHPPRAIEPLRQRQGARRVAPRAAQDRRRAANHLHDAVVDPVGDPSVVQQGEVGHRGEPFAHRLVVGARGLGGEVA